MFTAKWLASAAFIGIAFLPLPTTALSPITYECEIDMICRGVWTECEKTKRAAVFAIPGTEGAPLEVEIDGEILLFEDITPGSLDGSISAAGVSGIPALYRVLTFSDGRLGIVTSTDQKGDGMFYANGSFTARCEVQK